MTHTRNIMKAYRSATPQDHAEGMAWYDEAKAFAASLDNDVARAAAVIAILSPMTSWPQNVDKARRAYDGDRTRLGFHANRDKVSRILDNGEDYRDVLTGPKVTSFFHNIMGSPDHVTIDRHAVDIAIGKPLSNRERAVWLGVKNRAVLTEAYLRSAVIASRESGMTIAPYQVQAATWVWWRKNKAAANHG